MQAPWTSISGKIFLGYATILIITALAAVTLTQTHTRSQQGIDLFIGQTLPQLNEFERYTQGVNALEIAAYSLYGTTTSPEDFDSERATLDKNIDHASERLQQLNSQTSKTLAPLREDVDNSLNRLHRIMAASSVDWDGARDVLSELSGQTQALHKAINTLKQQVSNEAQQSSKMIVSDMSSATATLYLLVSVIILVAVSAYLLSRKQISAPIGELASSLNIIADNHDLTVTLPDYKTREVSIASQSINELLSAFRTGISDVSSAINSISQSAGDLGSATSTSEDTVRQLEQAIEQLLITMANLSEQITQSNNCSQSASGIAQRGADEVRIGADAVEKTSQSIASLATNLESTAAMLLELRTSGDQVSNVVSTIAEIADQTNLLALNAAIEAARAGDTGRGFAVVADEVRTLANRTHQSTVEINDMLESIVSSITASVNTMTTNQEQAQQSVSQAESTVSSLADIQQTILSLSNESQQAAELSEQAQHQVEAAQHQTNQFRELGEQVTHNSQTTQQSAEQLTDLSQSLSQLAERFKT